MVRGIAEFLNQWVFPKKGEFLSTKLAYNYLNEPFNETEKVSFLFDNL